jgi:hypothetical protein
MRDGERQPDDASRHGQHRTEHGAADEAITCAQRRVPIGIADVTDCLYCPAKNDGPFRNAEHVLPQSFGKFDSREGNLTLHSVCPDCNANFGRHLEQHFGRDTVDAYFRLLSRVKPAEEAAEVGGRRLTFSVEMPGSEFHGSWMTLAYDPQREIVLQAPPQVAFRRRDATEWRWFLERDLTEERLPELRKSEFRIYGSRENSARILEKMRAIGLAPVPGAWTDISAQTKDPTFETVRIRYVIDEVVIRTVAKIAFNYLAWVTEAVVPGFVRRDEFEAIRAFIRYGTRPSWNVVGVGAATADLGDTRKMRITSGHVLVGAWPDPRSVPVGNVSLFNQVTYIVRFTDQVPGIWWDLYSGHYFDVQKHEVRKMVATNPVILGG